MIRIKYPVVVIIVIVILNSCQYDSVEELYPTVNECDTSNISYANDIWPIISENCTSCHSGAAASGNINLENYDQVKSAAESGKLLSVIKHEPGWSPMPKGANKLSDCSISKIENWVELGYPDN